MYDYIDIIIITIIITCVNEYGARRFGYGIILVVVVATFFYIQCRFFYCIQQKRRIFHMGDFIHTHTWCVCARI